MRSSDLFEWYKVFCIDRFMMPKYVLKIDNRHSDLDKK